MMEMAQDRPAAGYSAAEIGALAHLYRGEMYQSKIWRNRLDTTSNWAVVITGIALSVSFSHAGGVADPDPAGQLGGSGRRYLYYDLFRVRVRVMEINFYGPMLRGQGITNSLHERGQAAKRAR